MKRKIVNSVYCAVPTGEAMVATLSPEKIIGWVNEPSAAAMEYLPENLASMPVIGGWMGQQVTANMEDIITLDPDIIILDEPTRGIDIGRLSRQ